MSILLLQIRTRNGDDDNKREDLLLEEQRLSPARERSIEKVMEESVWGEVRSDDELRQRSYVEHQYDQHGRKTQAM